MKKAMIILSVISMGIFYSCDENKQSQTSEDEEYEIQGEETGGMGTGPGPGVEVPLDSAGENQPDTISIN